MHHTVARALLAGAMGLGVLSGLARADERPVTPIRVTPEELLSPEVPAAPVMHSKPAKHRPVRDWFRNLGCYVEPNNLGCTSFRATTRFIFGSCREFFGEPCLQGPQSSQLLGHGPGGCNCR
jgi:hypothetical protein